MAFNYFIAYDLCKPGQNYEAVTQCIKALGPNARMQQSLYYVQSDMPLEDVHTFIRGAMDPNDRLSIIWARDAFVSNYNLGDLHILQSAFQNAA
ncbi:hypothetical protein ACO2I3_15500 [Leptospira interrogans]